MAENEKLKKEQTLEEQFQELEEIVLRMEREEISLEESFQLYQKGMALLKGCNDTIDAVEKKVLMLDEEGNIHEF